MTDLSIILPTYNGARYLDEQIRSIQIQSIDRWRLLVCDDGSSDGTLELLRAAAAADPRITVLPSTGNQGQQRRLRQLVHASETEIIAVADQDDIWVPDKLEKLLDGLGDNDMCFGSSWLIDSNGREIGREIADHTRPSYAEGGRLAHLFRALVSAHAMVARRPLFSDAVLSRALPFDWCMCLEAAFGRGLAYVPEARTLHRIHPDNQSNYMLRNEPVWTGANSWRQIKGAGKYHARSRMEFVARLEHLIFSDRVDQDVRHRMRTARQLCMAYWYEGKLSFISGSALLSRLTELLEPLAGSALDLAFARACMAWLCADVFHPAWFGSRAERQRIEQSLS